MKYIKFHLLNIYHKRRGSLERAGGTEKINIIKDNILHMAVRHRERKREREREREIQFSKIKITIQSPHQYFEVNFSLSNHH